jgi:hypothetical protein
MATPTQIRELVDGKALPLQAMATLDVVAAVGTSSGAEIERLLEVTAEVLAACVESREVMNAKCAA